tara:strand:+ start:2698 stop:3339 length:642 start_codon:yes stop_codon:yes gene_type:complete
VYDAPAARQEGAGVSRGNSPAALLWLAGGIVAYAIRAYAGRGLLGSYLLILIPALILESWQMPKAFKRLCDRAGCMAYSSGRFCEAHTAKAKEETKSDRKARDKARGSAAARGYGARWQKARRVFLMSNPLCVCCERMGHTEAAIVVDHIIPHKGDMDLFWKRSNWQGLCEYHHAVKTAGERQWGKDKSVGRALAKIYKPARTRFVPRKKIGA